MIFFPVTIYYYLVKAFIKLLLRGHIREDLKGLKHDSGALSFFTWIYQFYVSI